MRILMAAFAALVLGFSAGSARADSFYFEEGIVSPSGQQITVLRLPVRLSNGKLVYKDVTLRFTMTNGKLKFATGFPKVANSPALLTGPFVAGEYYSAANKSHIYKLDGPVPGPNGRQQWTMTYPNYPLQITFYTGAIKGHPLEDRIKAAGINAPYTFGIIDVQHSYYEIFGFQDGDLVAITKTAADTFVLYDYTDVISGSPVDVKLPVTSATFRKK